MEPNHANEIILYQPDEALKLEVRLDQETVWLTQQQIADLFGTKRPTITKHLSNIFKSGELDEDSVRSILEHTLRILQDGSDDRLGAVGRTIASLIAFHYLSTPYLFALNTYNSYRSPQYIAYSSFRRRGAVTGSRAKSTPQVLTIKAIDK